MRSVQIRHSVYLFIAAILWGTTFVAQSLGMKYLGPFSYNMCRFLLGFAVLTPLGIFSTLQNRRKTHSRMPASSDTAVHVYKKKSIVSRAVYLLLAGCATGAALFAAGSLQQVGMVYTTVGKAGFLTALYILMVPILGIFLGRHCSFLVWSGVGLALIGLYLLCVSGVSEINRGDVLMLGSAFSFAVQILCVDHFSPRVNGIWLSALQFLVSGLLSVPAALLLEHPDAASVLLSWKPIAYAGVMSCGIAYTLQILGQRDLNPTIASLIMSLESSISAISGWIILGQALSPRELAGCVLMFCAIILAQLPVPQKRKTAPQ